MTKLKINEYVNRRNVMTALVENGYTVREEKLRLESSRDYDYFVVIVEEPVFPKYKANIAISNIKQVLVLSNSLDISNTFIKNELWEKHKGEIYTITDFHGQTIMELNNGTRFISLSFRNEYMLRGIRIEKAYISRDVDFNYVNTHIYPLFEGDIKFEIF